MKKPSLNLKQRISLVFICCLLLIFGGIMSISNYSIQSILENKIETGYENTANQLCLMMENTISNMNHVSQLLVVGSAAEYLEGYFHAEPGYDKIRYSDSVREQMAVLTFTNPTIGLTAYLSPGEDKPLFTTGTIRDKVDLDQMPLLMESGTIRYYGPMQSLSQATDRTVLAAVRSVQLSDGQELLLYVESAFHVVDDILEANQGQERFPILFLDPQGTITYSESESFATGIPFSEEELTGFYPFRVKANQGWEVVMLVPEGIYMQERNQWIESLAVFCVVIVIFCAVMVWMLWRMIYRPLGIFERRMSTVLEEAPASGGEKTNIAEYDELLEKFEEMRGEIRRMIQEISVAEQRRADLEVEKLRYQINPHFLMNTLNTVHWMALMNNQDDIDHTVQSLNRLLLYNLNKQNREATLADEVMAIREYLALQQVRYDFSFVCTQEPPDDPLAYACPKFILQPLVENALYHGYSKDMTVSLRIRVTDRIEVTVADNGNGMTPEQLEKMCSLKEDSPEEGLGIGFSYVIRSIHRRYHGKADWSVESRLGEGTAVHLYLPKEVAKSC